jgi:hypothetical protein
MAAAIRGRYAPSEAGKAIAKLDGSIFLSLGVAKPDEKTARIRPGWPKRSTIWRRYTPDLKNTTT